MKALEPIAKLNKTADRNTSSLMADRICNKGDQDLGFAAHHHVLGSNSKGILLQNICGFQGLSSNTAPKIDKCTFSDTLKMQNKNLIGKAHWCQFGNRHKCKFIEQRGSYSK